MDPEFLQRVLNQQLTARFKTECTRNKARFSEHHTSEDQVEVHLLVDEFLLNIGTYFPEWSLLCEETQRLAANAIRLGGYRSMGVESFFSWRSACLASDDFSQMVRFCRAIEEIYETTTSA
jgi:hypothetical protein